MNRLNKLVLGKNSFKSPLTNLLLIATLILSCISGCSNITSTAPPNNETSSSSESSSTYKPEHTVTFAEISTKLQSLGLENAGAGVFIADLRDPYGGFGGGALQIHLKRGDNLPAYEADHQVMNVKFIVYTMGMTLNSDNKPIVEHGNFEKTEEWKIEGGNQLIDKFWKAIKIWNELRYSGSIEKLEAEIVKGIIASNNKDGEVTNLLGEFRGYLSTRQLTPFGDIHVATTGYVVGGGVYVEF